MIAIPTLPWAHKLNGIHDGAEDIHQVVREGVDGNISTKHFFGKEVELFSLCGALSIKLVCKPTK